MYLFAQSNKIIKKEFVTIDIGNEKNPRILFGIEKIKNALKKKMDMRF